jgi:hypothetical protein
MNNAIMRPRAKPTIVPAATPRQSTFCSPCVIAHSPEATATLLLPYGKRPQAAGLKPETRFWKARIRPPPPPPLLTTEVTKQSRCFKPAANRALHLGVKTPGPSNLLAVIDGLFDARLPQRGFFERPRGRGSGTASTSSPFCPHWLHRNRCRSDSRLVSHPTWLAITCRFSLSGRIYRISSSPPPVAAVLAKTTPARERLKRVRCVQLSRS